MRQCIERPRRSAFRSIAAIVLGTALAATLSSCGAQTAIQTGVTTGISEGASTTQSTGHVLLGASGDTLPALVVDWPSAGATVQSPVRVTGNLAGGTAVNVSLLIISPEGYAGQAAKLLITLTVLPVGGSATSFTETVPITLQ